jgi:hypothetical protein
MRAQVATLLIANFRALEAEKPMPWAEAAPARTRFIASGVKHEDHFGGYVDVWA